ncbi:TniB family NTP-binding protein [Peribacillus butanolivorans]|uniref:TniB family NTP-binding protein n=1 Tax=Peribacillus butanolivorans TaxID=421767 RepID=UPI0036B84F4A
MEHLLEDEKGFFSDMDNSRRIKVLKTIKVKHPDYLNTMKLIQMCHKDYLNEVRVEPLSCIITGDPGLGKTTIFKDYIAQFDETSYSDVDTKRKILWANVPTPVRPNFLMSKLLQQLGDNRFNKGTDQEGRRARLVGYIKDCGIELIMLDEFQHFVNLKNKKPLFHYADWFKLLINETKVPIILFGLDYAHDVLNENEQLKRRYKREYRLKPFAYKTKENVLVFKKVLSQIEKQLPFDEESQIKDHSDIIHFATKGIMDNVMSLIREASILSIYDGDVAVRLKHLYSAFDMDYHMNDGANENPFDSIISEEPQYE